MVQESSTTRHRTLLAALGDANDQQTYSGTPYHFLHYARSQGILDEGLRLLVKGPKWRLRRVAWNGAQWLTGDRCGGYQYSVPFLENLWASSQSQCHGSVIVNCFQMFPPSIVADQSVEKWFFIDQTLLQLFDYYGYRTLAGRRIVQDSLYREKEGYLAATGIIANSKWAARDVIDNYGVPPSRVHVVQLGANITPEDYSLWEREAASSHLQLGSRALRLVFVGKDWRRKGLDRLIRALQMARRAGSTASLRVIGCAREDVSEDLRNAQGVQWMGFIDKGINPIRFLSSVSECDLGCLLSRSEAGGIGLLEYHALGLAVLGPLTGGTPEGAIDGASILCSPAMPDEEIADLLLSLDRDRSRVEQMRAISWAQRRTVLWENSLSQLRAFWPYPHENAVVVEDTPIL